MNPAMHFKISALAAGLLLGAAALAAPGQCPAYAHKDSLLGQPASLPNGFFVYGLSNMPGLYTSPVRTFNQTMVPNTQNDSARSIEISDDGNWIVYRSKPTIAAYLIKTDGTKKTVVPMTGVASGMPKYVGFYRNSPYGAEVFCYIAKGRVDAIKVDLSSGTPVFSAQRTILQISGTAITNEAEFMDWQMAVAGDQLMIRAGTGGDRMTYYTIPNGGQGTAGDANQFTWKNDSPPQNYYGCSITMSHDGSMVAFNPGWEGNGACVPNKFTAPAPMDHKGFCITPFRHTGVSPAMTWNENVDVYGTSINWAPNEFRFGQYWEVDFIQWYFANNSDYIIGVLRGDLSQVKGMWVVEWKTNRWTLVTPGTQEVLAFDPAIYLAPASHVLEGQDISAAQTDPVDPDDPQYQVVSPAGGEIYRVGDMVRIQVRSAFSAASTVYLRFGKRTYIPDSLNRPIDPAIDSMLRFIIPDSAAILTGPDQITNYSLILDSCAIVIRTYGGGSGYTVSSPYFSIRARNASVLPAQSRPLACVRTDRLVPGSGFFALNAGIRGAVFFDCKGTKVWEHARSGEISTPVNIIIPRSLRHRIMFCDCFYDRR